ncbi:UAA transporter, partial [Tulasnella sp. UAMH 9824]
MLSCFLLYDVSVYGAYGDYSFTACGFILALLNVPRRAQDPPHLHPSKSLSSFPVLPPSPPSKSFTNGTTTPPKSPYLAAHQHIRSSPNTSAPSSTFHTSSSSLAKRFVPLKAPPVFKRFGFITKRFDMNMRNQVVVSTSIKLHPLSLLMRTPPLAFVQCLFYAWVSGELDRAAVHEGPVGVGGARRRNRPLAMALAANVKQVPTMLLAMYMFHLTITPANSIGIALECEERRT